MSFGSYGETVILAAQNLVILALVYRFAKLSTSRVMLVGAVLVGLLGAVFSGGIAVPPPLVSSAQAPTTQVWAIMREFSIHGASDVLQWSLYLCVH